VVLAGPGLDEFYAQTVSGVATSYLRDALGSTLALTDGSGAITGSYAYGAYGSTTSSGTSATSFQYTGRENDGAANLYYYRARYYSAGINRFISEDPIGFQGGTNFYAYVRGNPISYRDPSGTVAIAFPVSLPGIPAPPPVAVAAAIGAGLGTAFNYAYEAIAGEPFGASIYEWTHPAIPDAAQAVPHASEERKAAEDECYERCEHHLCGGDPGPYRLCFNTCMKNRGFDTGLGPTHVRGR
jgi:RHS repeat-associated protein